MIEAESRAAAARSLDRTIGDAAATKPGATLVVIGGLHANEPAGIEAARRVHGAVGDGTLDLRAGRLVSMRGNLAALSAKPDSAGHSARYIDEDLNRAFIEDPENAESLEQVERRALTGLLQRIAVETTGPVYLLDLHTMSSDSPAFVALEDSLPARRFASCFPLPKVLGMEEELPGLLVDYATTDLGCVACIAEAGRHDDPRAVDVHESLVLIALETLGMIGPQVLTIAGEQPFEVASGASGSRGNHYYDLRERVSIGDSSFRMQPGAAAFLPVMAKRTVVAVECSRSLTPELSGYLFLPNRQASPRVGDDGFFVVCRVGRVWLWLSAKLRRCAWVHRWLPRLLPGVRQRLGDPHALVIAPEYAAVFRREVLHLLGYRLVRWSHPPYMTRRKRVLMGAAGIARSIIGIVTRAFRGAERAALPEERPEDWIARRRTLDVSRSQK